MTEAFKSFQKSFSEFSPQAQHPLTNNFFYIEKEYAIVVECCEFRG